ncbi:PIR Superfamily Protein [Plasmodium ovale wallikeri]|uniref:PIR Superfamily Protein n=2 Tax=Plasmodium ovale TaxID=36330 RepID=A0A1A9ATI0_PLAOA|nr:PIR Superfamily Protein [Plasmodium ovale wallikeri]SBT59571.1 PIR Superfamily Protein [Plasmodium ovale wallikeri]SBT73894.1 PIR protein [Plasmodium ovale]
MNNKSYNLEDSPSYKFNKDLNNINDYCQFCTYCDNETYFSYNYGLKVLCYNFANNLRKIYDDFVKNENLNEKRCNDLVYWWYNNLHYTYKKSCPRNCDEIVNIFKNVWSNIIQSKQNNANRLCKNFLDDLLCFERYEIQKKASDYCENYEFIEKKLKETNINCSNYYHYLTRSKDLYEKTVSKCHTVGSQYCLNFKQCHTYNPENLLKNEKCKLIQKTENEDAELAEKAAQLMTCPPEYKCVPDYIINASINFSDYRFISLIILSIWAVILSFFFLYKFTTFGSILNNILHRKNSIRKNIHEEEFHELLESDSEDVPINFNNREYRITYNHE